MKFCLLVALLPGSLIHATDAAREQRWIEQTVDSIVVGTPVYLNADGHRFLGIYTESETPATRGVIVTHGTGFHPDWYQVVQPVRVEMTAHGWHTLSIQMPLLDNSAAYEDYVPLYPEVPARLEAATQYLARQGIDTIVIVAHSQGATMASYYLANTEHQISALVAIGMSAQHLQPHINSAESLKKIALPVLDVFGARDFPAVLRTAGRRKFGAAHNKNYTQVVIPDAYHFFDDHEDELLETLISWLDQFN
ncbi:hypothetical protein AB833_24445 [Chromatiales bacterium (ex Bugula neritina AB1)]|nr:hypothetical protein AB833_24445 [Chromatiales bacterium (ex Bugula neritina AB1)]